MPDMRVDMLDLAMVWFCGVTRRNQHRLVLITLAASFVRVQSGVVCCVSQPPHCLLQGLPLPLVTAVSAGSWVLLGLIFLLRVKQYFIRVSVAADIDKPCLSIHTTFPCAQLQTSEIECCSTLRVIRFSSACGHKGAMAYGTVELDEYGTAEQCTGE